MNKRTLIGKKTEDYITCDCFLYTVVWHYLTTDSKWGAYYLYNVSNFNLHPCIFCTPLLPAIHSMCDDLGDLQLRERRVPKWEHHWEFTLKVMVWEPYKNSPPLLWAQSLSKAVRIDPIAEDSSCVRAIRARWNRTWPSSMICGHRPFASRRKWHVSHWRLFKGESDSNFPLFDCTYSPLWLLRAMYSNTQLNLKWFMHL
jgi:hypothetical protein